MTAQPTFTYQTRFATDAAQDAVLSAYAALHGEVERTLFAASRRGAATASLKAEFQRSFGITARQFNAVRVGLDGKIASIFRFVTSTTGQDLHFMDHARNAIRFAIVVFWLAMIGLAYFWLMMVSLAYSFANKGANFLALSWATWLVYGALSVATIYAGIVLTKQIWNVK